MVADLQDRTQVENFLRDASAAELMEQRHQLQALMAGPVPSINPLQAEWLVARIAYELRFRMPVTV